MWRSNLLSLLLFFSAFSLFGQNFLKQQVPEKKKYKASEVIDQVYGIEKYEAFNFLLGGDSVRHCGDYVCSGWVEDFYEDGTTLHKGYYIEGQLKVYKNFYPNGAMERHFRVLDNIRSSMKKYYSNGSIKSEITYLDDAPLVWIDYYKNGNIDFIEEYTKNFKYQKKRASYNEDGTPQNIFELLNRKKQTFLSQEYHENGKLKVKGEMMYNENAFDVVRHGDWEYYNEEGTLVKSEKWQHGTLKKSKEH
jgi:antitoxin component YwqK of YwqJK toxin-antitoxin module